MRRDKAFMAEVEDHFLSLAAAMSSSSSSSSSNEEIAPMKEGKKDAGGPAGLCFMAKAIGRGAIEALEILEAFAP